MRPLPGDSGIEVVSAATIAPVSSNEHSFSAIAARITASCHSNGIESERTHSTQWSCVRSSRSRALLSIDAASGSSGPRIIESGRWSTNQVASETYEIGASVVSRSVRPGVT